MWRKKNNTCNLELLMWVGSRGIYSRYNIIIGFGLDKLNVKMARFDGNQVKNSYRPTGKCCNHYMFHGAQVNTKYS